MALLSSLAGITKLDTTPGLAGKFFDGDFLVAARTGDIGTLPLTPTNNNPGMPSAFWLPSTNHLHGVYIWNSISFGNVTDGPGNNYGFIAIGYFLPPTSGTYSFFTSSDDNSGVWLGDIASASSGRSPLNAVVNNNLSGAGQGETKRGASRVLEGGTPYAIRIVHQEGLGGDIMTFSWSGPEIAETQNLTQYFYVPGSSTDLAASRNFY